MVRKQEIKLFHIVILICLPFIVLGNQYRFNDDDILPYIRAIEFDKEILGSVLKNCLVDSAKTDSIIGDIKNTYMHADEFESSIQQAKLRNILDNVYTYQLYTFLLTKKVPRKKSNISLRNIDMLQMHTDSLGNYTPFDSTFFLNDEALYSAFSFISYKYSGRLGKSSNNTFQGILSRHPYLSFVYANSRYYSEQYFDNNIECAECLIEAAGNKLTDSIMLEHLDYIYMQAEGLKSSMFISCDDSNQNISGIVYDINIYLFSNIWPLINKLKNKTLSEDKRNLISDLRLYRFYQLINDYKMCETGNSASYIDTTLLYIERLRNE